MLPQQLPYILVDSHAHLTSPACVDVADALVAAAAAVGVQTIVNICTDAASLEAGIALGRRCPSVYNAGATTPHDVASDGDVAFDLFAASARAGALVAIGETGLDYYYEHSPRELQQHYLRRYLQLAKECQLPLVFHCRDAFADLFAITDDAGGDFQAVLHCFTGTAEEAAGVLARGWYISLSGIVTYKKSEALRSVAATVPLERLVIETDSPYLAPQSQRGQPNQPAYLVETARVLAQVKGVPFEEVAAITSHNAQLLFNRL